MKNMNLTSLNRWRAVRVSLNTGRVLKVLATFDNPQEAESWTAGFGNDPSGKTTVRWERCP